RREAIPNRSQALERARLKALELDARRCGLTVHRDQFSEPVKSAVPFLVSGLDPPAIAPRSPGIAAASIMQGIDSYLRAIINTEVGSQLANLGFGSEGGSIPRSMAAELVMRPAPERDKRQEPTPNQETHTSTGKTLLSAAIESYLKDVEPPQREQKTYDEY